jgi:F0F1-type ATP synthase membrane subunit c/vacuolar-type H+-ATPase subunit K
VRPGAWIVCLAWIAVALGASVVGARRGLSAGRGRRVAARLKSPTVYLFTGYLVLAALVTPHSAEESVSPLLGLALVLPIAYALASLSAIGDDRGRPAAAIARAAIHGGAVIAAATIVLAWSSPAFVPGWLR